MPIYGGMEDRFNAALANKLKNQDANAASNATSANASMMNAQGNMAQVDSLNDSRLQASKVNMMNAGTERARMASANPMGFSSNQVDTMGLRSAGINPSAVATANMGAVYGNGAMGGADNPFVQGYKMMAQNMGLPGMSPQGQAAPGGYSADPNTWQNHQLAAKQQALPAPAPQPTAQKPTNPYLPGAARGGAIGDVEHDTGRDTIHAKVRPGEYMLNPETVAHGFGGGDYDKGLRALNEIVRRSTGVEPGPTYDNGEKAYASGGSVEDSQRQLAADIARERAVVASAGRQMKRDQDVEAGVVRAATRLSASPSALSKTMHGAAVHRSNLEHAASAERRRSGELTPEFAAGGGVSQIAPEDTAAYNDYVTRLTAATGKINPQAASNMVAGLRAVPQRADYVDGRDALLARQAQGVRPSAAPPVSNAAWNQHVAAMPRGAGGYPMLADGGQVPKKRGGKGKVPTDEREPARYRYVPPLGSQTGDAELATAKTTMLPSPERPAQADYTDGRDAALARQARQLPPVSDFVIDNSPLRAIKQFTTPLAPMAPRAPQTASPQMAALDEINHAHRPGALSPEEMQGLRARYAQPHVPMDALAERALAIAPGGVSAQDEIMARQADNPEVDAARAFQARVRATGAQPSPEVAQAAAPVSPLARAPLSDAQIAATVVRPQGTPTASATNPAGGGGTVPVAPTPPKPGMDMSAEVGQTHRPNMFPAQPPMQHYGATETSGPDWALREKIRGGAPPSTYGNQNGMQHFVGQGVGGRPGEQISMNYGTGFGMRPDEKIIATADKTGRFNSFSGGNGLRMARGGQVPGFANAGVVDPLAEYGPDLAARAQAVVDPLAEYGPDVRPPPEPLSRLARARAAVSGAGAGGKELHLGKAVVDAARGLKNLLPAASSVARGSLLLAPADAAIRAGVDQIGTGTEDYAKRMGVEPGEGGVGGLVKDIGIRGAGWASDVGRHLINLGALPSNVIQHGLDTDKYYDYGKSNFADMIDKAKAAGAPGSAVAAAKGMTTAERDASIADFQKRGKEWYAGEQAQKQAPGQGAGERKPDMRDLMLMRAMALGGMGTGATAEQQNILSYLGQTDTGRSDAAARAAAAKAHDDDEKEMEASTKARFTMKDKDGKDIPDNSTYNRFTSDIAAHRGPDGRPINFYALSRTDRDRVITEWAERDRVQQKAKAVMAGSGDSTQLSSDRTRPLSLRNNIAFNDYWESPNISLRQYAKSFLGGEGLRNQIVEMPVDDPRTRQPRMQKFAAEDLLANSDGTIDVDALNHVRRAVGK